MTHSHTFFTEHGWAVLKGVLTIDEVNRLTKAYDTLIDPNTSLPSSSDVVQLTQPHLRHPIFAENLSHPNLWKAVTDTLLWDRAQLLQDVLLYRTAPSSGRVEWHCDHTYTAFLTPPLLASVRVALTHSRPTSGCLQVLDKSHLFDHSGPSDIFGASIERGRLDSLTDHAQLSSRVKPIELEPGDISIHHSKTMHGSFENHTDEEQKVIVHHIFDSTCRFDPSKLPNPSSEAFFAVKDSGHLDPTHFPLLG